MDDLKKELCAYYREYISIQNAMDLNNELYLLNAEIFNAAPLFFSIIYKSLEYQMCISLAKLFDKNYKTKNIYQFVAKCKNLAHLFPDKQKVQDELNIFEQEIEQNKSALLILRKRRNKLYAHNDEEFFLKPEQICQEYLAMYDLEILLYSVRKMLMFLINELSVDISSFKRYADCNDLSNLLDKLN